MEYVGAMEDHMCLVIAAALCATGNEYNHRHGKKDMPTEHIEISDAGARMRVFSPIGENTIAISMDMLDMDEDEDDAFGGDKPAADKPPPAAAKSPTYKAPPLCKHCNEGPCVLTQCDGVTGHSTIRRHSMSS
jgi:hypothetical protein